MSTELLYLYDILAVVQPCYFQWNVTWITEENNKLNCRKNPITHNVTRSKPCLISCHYHLLCFVPDTTVLAWVLISSALCLCCWHLSQLSPHCASQASQTRLQTLPVFLHASSLFLISLSAFSTSALLFPAYRTNFWWPNDSPSTPFFTPAPPRRFLFIRSSGRALVITTPYCCHSPQPFSTECSSTLCVNN